MEKQEIYYVYAHVTKESNNTFYVGKGKGNRAYESHKGRHSEIWESISKKDFNVIILENNLTEEQAFILEKIYIKKYKALGMCVANITNGGKGIDIENRWWGNAISKALKGIEKPLGIDNKSYKNNVTVEQLKHDYINLGMSTTEIGLKYNLSYATISSRLKDNNIQTRNTGRVKVKIKCLNDGKEYNSISEASKNYDLFRENISKVLNGKYKHTGGYKFIKI